MIRVCDVKARFGQFRKENKEWTLKDHWYAYMQGVDYAEYMFETYNEGKKPRFVKLQFAWNMIQSYVLGLVCVLVGHDWEDESYGGPETGCIAGYCKRCGYSFHETLY